MLTEDFIKFRERLEKVILSGEDGEKDDFAESDLELFRAIMRTGIDFDTACVSMMIPDVMIVALRGFQDIKAAIRQAKAQFKVMAYGRIWGDGGPTGVKMLLEMSGKEKGDDIYG